MPSREYRLWGYSPSHARLVLRAPADSTSPMNEDHVFSGVRHVDLPASISGLSVRRASPDETFAATARGIEIASETALWILESHSRPNVKAKVGEIVAISHRGSENDLPLFQTQLDDETPSARNAFEFEQSVLLSIASLRPISGKGDGGVDFWLQRADGHRVGVQTKWFPGRPTPSATRSLVMRLVPAISPEVAAFVVIFGGISDAKGAAEFDSTLRESLLTVLGGYGVKFEVFSADERSPEELRAAVGALID